MSGKTEITHNQRPSRAPLAEQVTVSAPIGAGGSGPTGTDSKVVPFPGVPSYRELEAKLQALKAQEAEADSSPAGEADTEESGFIELPVLGRLVSHFASELGARLAESRTCFTRDRLVVEVGAEGRVYVMTKEGFTTFIEGYVIPFTWKKVKEEAEASSSAEEKLVRQVRTMSVGDAGRCLESLELLRRLPKLMRVNQVRLPVRRKSGAIELLPAGYDEESGILTLEDEALQYDEDLSLDEAVDVLRDLLGSFPFEGECREDREVFLASHVAAMLTAFCMGLMPEAVLPAFIYLSNRPGGGKTLLAKMALAPVFHNPPPVPAGNLDELDKIINTSALEAAPYLLLDNIRGVLQSQNLESFITSSSWRSRVLGQSKTVEVDKQTAVLITGNNLTVNNDMHRRSLYVSLFVKEENNEDREIEKPLSDYVLGSPEWRCQLLAALWALVRHWDEQGRPKPEKLKPSFEQWSEVVPGIARAAGFEDCLKPAPLAQAGDERRKDMRELLLELAREGKPGEEIEYEFCEIIEVARVNDLFREVLGFKFIRGSMGEDDVHEPTPASKSKMGKILTAYKGQVFKFDEPKMKVRFGYRKTKKRRIWPVMVLE